MKKFDKIAKLLEGVASVISLYPQKNKRKITLPSSPVGVTLKNDWEKIGLDMWQAFITIESQQSEADNYRGNNDRFEKYSTRHIY